MSKDSWTFPADTERKLNVHKTSSELLIYVQFTSCVYGVIGYRIDMFYISCFIALFFLLYLVLLVLNWWSIITSRF